MLFVEPKDPALEVWTGERLGLAGVRPLMGLEGRNAGTLRAVLDSLLTGGGTLYTVGDFSSGGADVPGAVKPRTADDQFLDALRARHRDVKVADVNLGVMRLRAKKSAGELALIRSAAKVSAAAHREVLHAIAPGMAEFEVRPSPSTRSVATAPMARRMGPSSVRGRTRRRCTTTRTIAS